MNYRKNWDFRHCRDRTKNSVSKTSRHRIEYVEKTCEPNMYSKKRVVNGTSKGNSHNRDEKKLWCSSSAVSAWVCVWFYYAPNYCACCFRTHNVCYSFQLIWNRGRTRLRKSFDGIWSSIFYEQQQQQQQSWQSINQQQRVLIVLGHNKWYLLQLSVANSWFARHGPTYIHSCLTNSFFWPPHSFHQDKQIQFCKAFWAAVNSGFFQSKCTN